MLHPVVILSNSPGRAWGLLVGSVPCLQPWSSLRCSAGHAITWLRPSRRPPARSVDVRHDDRSIVQRGRDSRSRAKERVRRRTFGAGASSVEGRVRFHGRGAFDVESTLRSPLRSGRTGAGPLDRIATRVWLVSLSESNGCRRCRVTAMHDYGSWKGSAARTGFFKNRSQGCKARAE